MKEKNHIWEADIRQKTLEHEFDYDSNAWDEMSLLLDEAAIPVTGSKAGPITDSGIGGSWKGIAIALLIVAIAALWFLNTQKPIASGLSDQLDTETKQLPSSEKESDAKLSSTTSIKKETEDSVKNGSIKNISYTNKANDRQSDLAQSSVQAADISEPDEPFEKTIDKKEKELLQRTSIKALTLLPSAKEIPLLKISKKPIKLELQLSKNKRSRDKNKLYPDVIENY